MTTPHQPQPHTDGWQPIETAPKEPLNAFGEGPSVILLGGFMDMGKPSVRTGFWKGKRTNAWCDTALGRCPRNPTHWQPLPKPPSTTQSQKTGRQSDV